MPSLFRICILKLLTECFEQIFSKNDLEENPTFNQLILNDKFEGLIKGLLNYISPKLFLIVNDFNSYS